MTSGAHAALSAVLRAELEVGDRGARREPHLPERHGRSATFGLPHGSPPT